MKNNSQKSVVFVCTGNTCRSPMAEVLAIDNYRKTDNKSKVVFSSAGIAAMQGQAASSGAKNAVAKKGLSLEHHKSRSLNNQMVEDASLVLTMTDSHKQAILKVFPDLADKVFVITEFDNKKSVQDVPDPFGAPQEIYDITAEKIEEEIIRIMPKIQEF